MNALNAPHPPRQIRNIFSQRLLILPLHRKASRAGTITVRQVIAQLRADLTGKDSHRGVTLSYTWLANQFGHFSLGFIPAIVLVYAFGFGPDTGSLPVTAAIGVSLFWTLFEILNFLGPLLLAKVPGAFAPAWKNIAFDTATDILFFCLGATIAASLLNPGPGSALVTIGLGILLMPMSYHWYLTKIYQQRSGFPKQLRLGQWNGTIDSAGREAIREFINGSGGARHLLVSGDALATCSDLGIALANECAIGHQSCRYLSATKLAALLAGPGAADRREDDFLRGISTLVIDECSAGAGPGAEAFGPAYFERMLAGQGGALNRTLLRTRDVIWVLGRIDDAQQRAWIAMLQGAGLRRSSITAVRTRAVQRSGQNVILVSEGYQVRQAFDLEALV